MKDEHACFLDEIHLSPGEYIRGTGKDSVGKHSAFA